MEQERDKASKLKGKNIELGKIFKERDGASFVDWNELDKSTYHPHDRKHKVRPSGKHGVADVAIVGGIFIVAIVCSPLIVCALVFWGVQKVMSKW